jgi:hypothetical protein
MKSYTDLEQSKKLAEILPIESADMYWDYDVQKHEHYPMVMDDQFDDTCICAWSLAALLDVLPDDCGIDKEDEKYVASYITSDECNAYTESNPVDACYKMILKLHELKML